MGRTVAIDIDACIGCEACVEECPDVFAMGPGDLAQVTNPDGADEECIESAMDMCPVNCIIWED
ncbi:MULTISPECIES: ferredoxin [Maridesulfovibrio]|uniref:Ferredoxin n=1 Tax=Maridesulfovibrio salexigens (strain ATCC 14822 / DSM 2638 / NCIMB 8403 / VKM B-1763) TaxID=526222 RepID=C6C031_MARSD|nr:MULTISPECIES: ferredoxin [Maridesulfovibrio]ACS80902.1 4Fe-4S ferredoxin iron-sulfur binding domain protein [Maridesulfovibrio salexigens DSM 2638]